MRLTKKEKLFVEFLETKNPTIEMQKVWDEYIELVSFLKKEEFEWLTEKLYVKYKGKKLTDDNMTYFYASIGDYFD